MSSPLPDFEAPGPRLRVAEVVEAAVVGQPTELRSPEPEVTRRLQGSGEPVSRRLVALAPMEKSADAQVAGKSRRVIHQLARSPDTVDPGHLGRCRVRPALRSDCGRGTAHEPDADDAEE